MKKYKTLEENIKDKKGKKSKKSKKGKKARQPSFEEVRHFVVCVCVCVCLFVGSS